MGKLGPKRKFIGNQGAGHETHKVRTEKMTISDKLQILEEIERTDLVELFKDWKPRVSPHKKRGMPLDQRVSIAVTDAERKKLDDEVKSMINEKNVVNMSKFIRNRALGSVDIFGWKEIAIKALNEIEDVHARQKEIKKKKLELLVGIESTEDPDEEWVMSTELEKINDSLLKIVAQNKKRSQRLSGRMSRPEAETIKWRSQRLCISTSDYLRMMIFNLEPDSEADSHMSFDAKRRFYISILDVAKNGWGDPPNIIQCSQCENYYDEIGRLKERIRQLETFGK